MPSCCPEARPTSIRKNTALRATRAAGPGALLVDVRYSEMRGDLGAFDNVGIATFSGFSFCLGYAIDVL